MGENCITCDVVLGSFGFGVYYWPRCERIRPSGRISWILRFYWHALFGRPFGDSIFLLVKKDRGERHAKGLQSRPLESSFFIRGFGGETCVGPTSSPQCNLRDLGPSGGVPVVFACTASPESQAPPFFGNSLPKALLPPDSIVLHVVRRIRNIYRITNVVCCRKSGGCGCAFVFWGTQEPSVIRGPAKAQRQWVWWGEEESPKGISSGHSGMTELLPLKAKRRIWSLRRRGRWQHLC